MHAADAGKCQQRSKDPCGRNRDHSQGLPRHVSCDPGSSPAFWARRSTSCVAFTSRQWRDARFEAVVSVGQTGRVGILAKDPRELASRLLSLSFQGMLACITNDPAIQGCHEAWLLGFQGQHQSSTQFGCPYPTKQGSLSGETRRGMVWLWCVMPTAPVDMDREGGEIRANATLQ